MGPPARAMRAIWATLASVSQVSVLVIDCTATGCVPPIVVPPMRTSQVGRRRYSERFMCGDNFEDKINRNFPIRARRGARIRRIPAAMAPFAAGEVFAGCRSGVTRRSDAAYPGGRRGLRGRVFSDASLRLFLAVGEGSAGAGRFFRRDRPGTGVPRGGRSLSGGAGPRARCRAGRRSGVPGRRSPDSE